MSALYVPTRRAVYLSLGLISRSLQLSSQSIFILCYHSVADDWEFSVTEENLKKQLAWLATKYRFVSLKSIENHIMGKELITKPSVAITFDDGYRDIKKIKEYLSAHDIKPTVFVMSDRMRVNRIELGTDKKFLTKKDLLELVSSGWEVGCHTATHSDMEKLSEREAEREILKSKLSLEKQLELPIRYIAYPKGRYNSLILDLVNSANYSLGLSMDDGPINQRINPLIVPRIGVDGTHSLEEFKVLADPLVTEARRMLRYVLRVKEKFQTKQFSSLNFQKHLQAAGWYIRKLLVNGGLKLVYFKDFLYSLGDSTKIKITISPHNFNIKNKARRWIKKINSAAPDLEVQFVGSAALGLPGRKDIDLLAGVDRKALTKIAAKLNGVLGMPDNQSGKFFEWKCVDGEHTIEFMLADVNSKMYRELRDIFIVLKTNKQLFEEYKHIKLTANGMNYRDYELTRKKFFNRALYGK